MRFHVANLDISAASQQFVCILQHTMSLSHSGNHTDIYLETSPSGTPDQVEKML